MVYFCTAAYMHAGWINTYGYAFRDWLEEEQLPGLDEPDEPRFGFIMVPVNTPTSGRSLIRYIELIAAFRQAKANNKAHDQGGGFQPFFEEPRGWRLAHGPGAVEYLSRHGDVVDALRNWRQDQGMNRGWRIVKNVFIDMGVVDARGSLVELYEGKTSTARSDVYSAIGQLMIHSPPKCRRSIVLPENPPLPNELNAALVRLGMDLLQFTLDDEGAVIN